MPDFDLTSNDARSSPPRLGRNASKSPQPGIKKYGDYGGSNEYSQNIIDKLTASEKENKELR